MRKVTTVAGLERHPKMQSYLLDTSAELRRCPFCGAEAGFREDREQPHYLRAECSNSSCAVAMPYHYKTRDDAKVAWNRLPASERKPYPY